MTELIKDRYQLLDKLGQGGFGAVWRAFDNTLNREVAVKLLNLANENQEEMVARFKTESRVASSFEHQNILRVYDFGQDEGGRCFLVSELLKGSSLHEELKPKEPLPLSLTLDVLYQVSSALEVAHQQKTVHRDIKPPNIFLNEPRKGQGYVKLLDFGIAKVLGGKQESLTVTGQIMGTPHYMSPEQIVNIKLVDHRSDIYSLGIVFYQMLMGIVPFDDESYFSIMKHQMQSPMPKLDLPQYPSDLVSELQEILKVMTHKDVRKRCADASQILGRVEQIWRAHPHSINSLNTGQFTSITAEILAASETTKGAPSEGIERMLEPFSDADDLVDQMLSSVEPSKEEPIPQAEKVDEPKRNLNQDLSPPQKEGSQEVSPPSQTPPFPHTDEAIAPAPSSVVTISEQPTTFSPSPMINKPSQLKWIGLSIAALVVGMIVAWQLTREVDSPSQASANADTNSSLQGSSQSEDNLDLGTMRPPSQIVIEPDATVPPQSNSLEIELGEDELINSVELDLDGGAPIEANATVPVDLGLTEPLVDEGVKNSDDLGAPTDAEQKRERQAASPTKTKGLNLNKPKIKQGSKIRSQTKSKRKRKTNSRSTRPKITGKIRLSPDSVSYDLGQTATLKFPSSTKKLNGEVKLSSCAQWVSKSQNKVKFIKTGKCTLSACYGKECIKSDVINIVEPLF